MTVVAIVVVGWLLLDVAVLACGYCAVGRRAAARRTRRLARLAQLPLAAPSSVLASTPTASPASGSAEAASSIATSVSSSVGAVSVLA